MSYGGFVVWIKFVPGDGGMFSFCIKLNFMDLRIRPLKLENSILLKLTSNFFKFVLMLGLSEAS